MADFRDTELAWAAGFFDGEGWVGSRYYIAVKGKPKYRKVEIGIGQIDPQVLHRFRAAVGVGMVKGPYAGNQRTSRDSPRWYYACVGVKSVWLVFWDLEPYLSPIKRAQFLNSLNWYEESPVTQEGVISHR